ncbi:hypothetical protein RUND412_008524 [Rhizina undulata]
MSAKGKSRWEDTEEDAAAEAARKAAKDAKKKAKALRESQKLEAEAKEKEKEKARQLQDESSQPRDQPPSKRRRLETPPSDINAPLKLLRFPAPEITPCRHVDNYERLNHIEEGSYGIVSRARDKDTGEIVALKKLKLERETDGFPITSLREIQTLMASRHPNVVNIREVVMGDTLKEYVPPPPRQHPVYICTYSAKNIKAYSSPQSVFIVMDFIEHDLKTLSEDMQEPFLQSEIKTLLLQLVSATAHMHSQWIIHRDLKTSNLLMNNRGQIKVADFGLARYTGDPLPPLTQLVVTLWYRAPELLLGAKEYGTEIDMWSIGCIFGELLTREPLLQGKNEIDQLTKIFDLLGLPTEETWPTFRKLPNAKLLNIPKTKTSLNTLRTKFPLLTSSGVDLLSRLLALDPKQRISAEEVLAHPYFKEDPKPKSAEMFPTFPSKAGQEKRRKHLSPSAPMRGDAPVLQGDIGGLFSGRDEEEAGAGFQLRLGR